MYHNIHHDSFQNIHDHSRQCNQLHTILRIYFDMLICSQSYSHFDTFAHNVLDMLDHIHSHMMSDIHFHNFLDNLYKHLYSHLCMTYIIPCSFLDNIQESFLLLL